MNRNLGMTMGSLHALVLKNVTMPDGRVADITLDDGKVVHVGAPLTAGEVRDCTGLLVLPAAVDMHVHMRGGLQSGKEDWITGSRSALAGGVTVVIDQPNTVPPILIPETLRSRVNEARNRSFCQFAINSGIAAGTNIPAMWRAGALAFGEIFTAPSSYGEAVHPDVLQAALAGIGSVNALATIHAEEPVHGEDTDLLSHDRLRPAAGEIRAVRAVGKLSDASGPIHFCHMSTAGAVRVAKTIGTAEVTPHHLFLSRDSFSPDDTWGKVNPPLRREKERKMLWETWDAIDVVASDHAPHTVPEKSTGFADAPSGIPGVETMVPLLLDAVLEKRITLASVIEKTSLTPCRILGIPKAGFSVNSRADFALYPKKSIPITADCLHSRCGWTPFEGMPAVFPSEEVMAGMSVFRDGEFVKTPARWFAGRGYIGEHTY